MSERPLPPFRETYDVKFATDPEQAARLLFQEREQFGHILNDALIASSYPLPTGPIKILNVACGMGVETPVLVNQFGQSPNTPEQVSIIGIDPLERRIQIAQELADTTPGQHTFIVGDATRLGDYPEIPQEVDVALVRRQNVAGHPRWSMLFEQTMEKLRPGGIALVTSIGQFEHSEMIKIFEDLGYTPEESVPNTTRYYQKIIRRYPETVTMPIDSHIAVFTKPL